MSAPKLTTDLTSQIAAAQEGIRFVDPDTSGQLATIQPLATNGPFVLTQGNDAFTGGADKDVFRATSANLNPGDQLDGAGGVDDTLELLGGGVFDVWLTAKFEKIETILGSAADDGIIIDASQLADVRVIDGNGKVWGDDLKISGGDPAIDGGIDLSNVTVTGFSYIGLTTDNAVITLDDIEMAKRVYGYGANNHLILTQGELTLAQRDVLYRQGLETITNAGLTTTHQSPVFGQIDGDVVAAIENQAVFLDAGHNATLIGEENKFQFIDFAVGPGIVGAMLDPNDKLGIDTTGNVSLVGPIAGLVEGNTINVTVGGSTTEIGILTDVRNNFIFIDLNMNATTALVTELIHAVTFTRSVGSTSGVLEMQTYIHDLAGLEDMAAVTINAPVLPHILTAGDDAFTGGADKDVYQTISANLNSGDQLDGGAGGDDTLELLDGGTFDLSVLAKFEKIETILGSAADDVIKVGSSYFSDVKSIQGGDGNDTLQFNTFLGVTHLSGIETIVGSAGDDTIFLGDVQFADIKRIDGNGGVKDEIWLNGVATKIDLSGIDIVNFDRMVLVQDGTEITFDDKETAKLVDGILTRNDTLILTQGILTPEERAALHHQGVDTIVNNGITTTQSGPKLSNLAGDVVEAIPNLPVHLDAGLDSVLTSDEDLAYLQLFLFGKRNPKDSLGVDTSGNVSLSAGLTQGSEIAVTVAGVTTIIGHVDSPTANPGYSSVNFIFNEEATTNLVQALVRAFTFQRSLDSTTEGVAVRINLVDVANRISTNVINVEAPHKAPTEISLSAKLIAELATKDSEVGLLTAKDPNTGNTFSYTLLDDAEGRFAIHNDRLVVADGVKLDFEQKASHQVTVRVTDNTGLTLDRNFTIDVGDVVGERSNGTPSNDILKSGAGDDIFSGGAGRDTLSTGNGDDKLSGGLDVDTLTGDAGRDIFVFDTAVLKKKNTNIDKITDFNVRDDSIYLDNAIFTGLGKKGSIAKPAKLAKDAFWKGAKAHDASDRIVYNEKTGALYYDQDGKGAKAPIQIATLPKKLKTISEKDFFIV